ncbi:hypothetical protein D1872_323940 [compost metagenome]
MSLLEQHVSLLLRPAYRNDLAIPQLCFGLVKVLRQYLHKLRFRLLDMLPVRKLLLHRCTVGISRQLPGPGLE